jgi:hypothetical protein
LPIQLVALFKKFQNHFCVAILIARRATTFGKADYSDNQLLFGYIVGAFCKRPSQTPT